MYDKLMFIFLIILFGLMCCCFLGGNDLKEGYTDSKTIAASKADLSDKDNTQPDHKKAKEEEKNKDKIKDSYDNYNHFKENPSESTETIFYDKSGGTARIVHTTKYGSIITTDKSGASTTYSIISPASVGSQIYVGPNDSTATVVTIDGAKEIHTTSATGVIVTYKEDKQVDKNDVSKELNAYVPTTSITANENGDTKRTQASDQTLKNANKHPDDFTSSSTTAKDYKDILNATTAGNSQVPRGKEDLYILKSQIVPPNCPVCPTFSSAGNDSSSNDSSSSGRSSNDGSSSGRSSNDSSGRSSNDSSSSGRSSSGRSSDSNSNQTIVGLGKDVLHDALKGSSMFAPMQGSYFGTSFGANLGADYNGYSENEIEIEEEKEYKNEGDRKPIPVLRDYTTFGM